MDKTPVMYRLELISKTIKRNVTQQLSDEKLMITSLTTKTYFFDYQI